MRSLQILACLLLVCGSIGRTISAFPSIHQLQQQQQQLSKSGLLSIAPTTTSNTIASNQLSLSAMILHNSLRAGAGSSIKSDDASLLARYAQWVDEKPLLTKSMTAGIVTTIANLFSQIVLSSQSPQQSLSTMISGRRVVMHMLTGICFIGPYLHVWYGYLDRVLAMPQQKRATRTITKVIVDQSIGLCIFFPLYFTFLEIAESILLGRVPMIRTALEKCRLDLWSIAIMNWRIWPLTNLINFGIVPYQFRVLVNQIVSFFWFAYLSTRV